MRKLICLILMILLFSVLMPISSQAQELNLGSVDEFLIKRGFIVQKNLDVILRDKKLVNYFLDRLTYINSFIYIRGIFSRKPVLVVEFNNPETLNNEMIGDVLMIFDLTTKKLVDLRYYKDGLRHIWYEGNQPVPLFPGSLSIVNNSLW